MDIKAKLLNSYFWLMLAKWITRFLGIISTLILVRILTPTDFGIAAQAMMVVMFFQAISHSGADEYIIKLDIVTDKQLGTAWLLNISMRTLSALVVFILADTIANFLNEPKLVNVLRVACLVSIVGSFISPKIIILKKDLKFKAISTLDILAKILSFAATISLAFTFKNYWALILGNVVSVVVLIIGSYFIAPCMPTLTFSNIKEQFHFSKNVFFMTILGYLRNKIDILIVSQKFGSAGAGYYSLAQEFSVLPYTEVVEPISQPLYTSLAKSSGNINLQSIILNKYLSVVYSLLVPSIFGIMLLSEDLVLIVFGEQWLEIAPVLACLSSLMLVFSTNAAFKHVFVLSGRFKGAMLLDVFGITLILAALLINQLDSIKAFAEYRMFVGFVIYILSLLLVKVLLGVKVFPTVLALFVPTFSSIIMIIVLLLIKTYFLQSINDILNFFILVIVGCLIYFLTWSVFIRVLREKHFIWAFDYALMRRLQDKFLAYIPK